MVKHGLPIIILLTTCLKTSECRDFNKNLTIIKSVRKLVNYQRDAICETPIFYYELTESL
ncbi:hypothetical protein DQM28_01730 [Leptospira mayottensis]|uniref:Uncharacterized protein n=1 Tax=Leptospira mayottensis TaxID=1137606 RepID=A0ABM6Y5U7_9LEPT|nr:hypothetical protein DQM28_01730 [Leptospira mayottensis]